ncbi:hypothetical protein J6590_005272 [Homalodisca vitripennis]|nr:hypothetical protein J6590_005272 [Homalodisca vitripennis]
MNEVETQAQELLRHKEWASALGLFDQLLGYAAVKGSTKERLVSYLLGRSECCLELGKHEAVVSDCRKIIKLLAGSESSNNCGARARRRLVHALFTLQRFAEAEAAAAEWIASSGGMKNTNPEAVKMLERVRIGLQMANGQKNLAGKGPPPPVPQHPRMEDEMLAIDYRLESLFNPALDDRPRRNRKHPVELIGECSGGDPSMPNPDFHQPMLSFNHIPVELSNMQIIDPMRINCLQPQIDHITGDRQSSDVWRSPMAVPHAMCNNRLIQLTVKITCNYNDYFSAS